MTYTVATYIIEILKLLDVKRIYGIIGNSILDFIDALCDYRNNMRFVTTRHEQEVVSMNLRCRRCPRIFGVRK